MKAIETKIMQLRDQTWQIARESLDSGETRIYRTLTDIAEKLTNLTSASDKSQIGTISEGKMISIFRRYQDEDYKAELDVDRIDGRSGKCVWMGGEWLTPSDSAIRIKESSANPPSNPSTNGWDFWKYIDESSKTRQSIDRLRRNS